MTGAGSQVTGNGNRSSSLDFSRQGLAQFFLLGNAAGDHGGACSYACDALADRESISVR